MPEQNWTMRGEYMESCNCDYLCPCIYTNPQGPATYDHCIAVMAFRIDEGSCGAISLAGRKFALVIRSGRSTMAPTRRNGWPWPRSSPAMRAARPGSSASIWSAIFAASSSSRSNSRSTGTRTSSRSPTLHPSRSMPSSRATAVATLLHRQYRPPGQPPAGAGARQGNPRARLWPQPRFCRQRQQRPFCAVRLGGVGADRRLF
jgi:uncharacterized protein DUF1326